MHQARGLRDFGSIATAFGRAITTGDLVLGASGDVPDAKKNSPVVATIW
jgi:hypothetical protein